MTTPLNLTVHGSATIFSYTTDHSARDPRAIGDLRPSAAPEVWHCDIYTDLEYRGADPQTGFETSPSPASVGETVVAAPEFFAASPGESVRSSVLPAENPPCPEGEPDHQATLDRVLGVLEEAIYAWSDVCQFRLYCNAAADDVGCHNRAKMMRSSGFVFSRRLWQELVDRTQAGAAWCKDSQGRDSSEQIAVNVEEEPRLRESIVSLMKELWRGVRQTRRDLPEDLASFKGVPKTATALDQLVGRVKNSLRLARCPATGRTTRPKGQPQNQRPTAVLVIEGGTFKTVCLNEQGGISEKRLRLTKHHKRTVNPLLNCLIENNCHPITPQEWRTLEQRARKEGAFPDALWEVNPCVRRDDLQRALNGAPPYQKVDRTPTYSQPDPSEDEPPEEEFVVEVHHAPNTSSDHRALNQAVHRLNEFFRKHLGDGRLAVLVNPNDKRLRRGSIHTGQGYILQIPILKIEEADDRQEDPEPRGSDRRHRSMGRR